MTEKHYLKIISDLFRLTGYAKGIMQGTLCAGLPEQSYKLIEHCVKYLHDEQNLILMQLGEKK
jgi:hypothetical protein